MAIATSKGCRKVYRFFQGAFSQSGVCKGYAMLIYAYVFLHQTSAPAERSTVYWSLPVLLLAPEMPGTHSLLFPARADSAFRRSFQAQSS